MKPQTDQIYEWKGYGNRNLPDQGGDWISKCRLRIFDLREGAGETVHYLKPVVVVVSDLGAESGTSITNCAEYLTFNVCNEFDLGPAEVMWIEHYPHEGGDTEDMDIVEIGELRYYSRGLGKPQEPYAHAKEWRPVREPEWKLLKTLMPEEAENAHRHHRKVLERAERSRA